MWAFDLHSVQFSVSRAICLLSSVHLAILSEWPLHRQALVWPVLETLHPFSSWFLIRVLMFYYWVISSVQFSHSVISDSLWPYGLQHPRPPCPSPIPGGYSNSRPSCQWGHPTISYYVVPFSSCLQSFPASRSFPMSQFFTSGSQGIGVSGSASVLPLNIQGWFPLGLTRNAKIHLEPDSRVS